MTPRRALLAGALATPFLGRSGRALSTARVVLVGGGYGGATCARALRQAGLDVTLVEAEAAYLSCPFSNPVVAGLRDMAQQQFGYDHVAATGVRLVHARALGVDAAARTVQVEGAALPYDRLVLSPGVEMRLDPQPGALPGYGADMAERFLHAWKAGPQTMLLRRQLEAMPDGGTVAMSVPANPYRCPPGPYERASLIAHYLKTHKPRSKLVVLDAKDAFSKQKLFQAAWKALYPDTLEWVGLSNGGRVTGIDPDGTLQTEFGAHQADVVNPIPPQRAGAIAQAAGVADRTGWCPVDPVTFESRLVPGIHVIGDAAVMGAMPKSAFAAGAQAKVCADAIVALLAGQAPEEPRLINTCYSLVAPGYGISVAGVYRPVNGQLTDIEGAGGTSPLDAPQGVRAQEAAYAEDWYRIATAEAFGEPGAAGADGRR